MQRVMIIGSGGAGKSTLARQIGVALDLPVVHLDRLFWRPGWVETPREEWAAVQRDLVAGERWVLDGNYGGTLEIRLQAADTVIFLDLPRSRCVWGAVRRYLRYRGRSREDLGADCPEKLDWQFLRWIWTYPTTRRPGILARLAALPPEVQVVRLRSRRAVRRFVAGLR